MSKKISGAEYQLSKIFSSDFEYHIPSYQRPYAWAVDQASELFDDLYDFYTTETDEGYFLGSIVLIKEDGHPRAEVIDGQQRLTTLTILLATLASQVTGEQREMLYKYIVEPGNEFEGLEPKPRLTIRDRDKAFFAEYVQKLDFEGLLKLNSEHLANESQANIQANSKYFLNVIHKTFDGDIQRIKGFVTFIVQRCFLVAVSTPTQQSAFRVFSVMNSRGLDLQPTDIIKADVIGQISSETKREDYNERWEEMEIELGRSEFNELFSFIRMIYAKEKARKSVLEEFRNHVVAKINSPERLISEVLEPYSDALSIIKKANYLSASDATTINSYFRWLNRIDNSDWIPVAILFLSQQKNDSDYVLWFFKKLERLAAYLHICGKNVNHRIERYSEVISSIQDHQHSLENPVDTVELTEEEAEEMLDALNGDIYALPPRKRNYVILRLDAFLSDGGALYDPSILTIEHVLPQTVDPESEWAKLWPDTNTRKTWVHRIANLVPLNRRRNSQAQNYDFEKKKSAYFSGKKQVSSYVLTTQVLNKPTWTEETLEERQNELMGVMAENWSLKEAA